jgi:hypothetical protein
MPSFFIHKAMHFALVKTGGKFRCLNCDGGEPIKSHDVAKLLKADSRPLD